MRSEGKRGAIASDRKGKKKGKKDGGGGGPL